MTQHSEKPRQGQWINIDEKRPALIVPDNPIVGYIEGDGVGSDIWAASRPVFEAAVEKAYAGVRKLCWWKINAGEQSFKELGSYFPEESFDAIRKCVITIKGPLTTPVGGGFQQPECDAPSKTRSLRMCKTCKIPKWDTVPDDQTGRR